MENNTKKRGRPLGSTNKKSTNGSIYVTSFLEKQIEGAAINKKNSLGWVDWGKKNDYCLRLLDLYSESPTHNACVNFAVDAIIGEGIDTEAMQIDGSQVVPNPYQSWNELIKSLALDYILYQSYAIEIIVNKDGKTYSFYHIPMDKVRMTPFDGDGQITQYKICSDWTQPSLNTPVDIEAFDMLDYGKLKKGQPYLYVYRPYSPTSNYYPAPHYTAAIKAIQAEIAYLNYDLKNITNGFTPSGMLVLNEVEDDRERESTIRAIQQMFIGEENTNSLMISFRRNQEETAPEFVPFNVDAKADRYEAANARTINRIMAGHNIPSPMLIGMPDSTNSGFSSDSDKIETAFQLYMKIIGNNNRLAIVNTLNTMFKMNGVDVEVVLKPLKFNDFDKEDNQTTNTNATDKNQDTDADNVEEKVEGDNNKE